MIEFIAGVIVGCVIGTVYDLLPVYKGYVEPVVVDINEKYMRQR